jgi:hypothetical protein
MSDEAYQQEVITTVPNSSMAVVSLVAGILGLTFFPLLGSLVAIITGIMGRREVQESQGTLAGGGMATAGLVMGVIGISLSALCLCVFGVTFGSIFCVALSQGDLLILPGLYGLLF